MNVPILNDNKTEIGYVVLRDDGLIEGIRFTSPISLKFLDENYLYFNSYRKSDITFFFDKFYEDET